MVTLQLEGQEIQLPPEIAISDDAVRKAITPLFPQAAHATIQRTTDANGMTTIKLTKQAGTKGNCHVTLRHLIESPRHVNPALTLYQAYQAESQPTHTTVESILLAQQKLRLAIEQGEKEYKETATIKERLKNSPGSPSRLLPPGF